MPIRDWLICGHVALDKCNVSRRATSKQLLPARKQNGFELACLKMFFQVYLRTLGSKRDEKYTAGNRNAVEIPVESSSLYNKTLIVCSLGNYCLVLARISMFSEFSNLNVFRMFSQCFSRENKTISLASRQ